MQQGTPSLLAAPFPALHSLTFMSPCGLWSRPLFLPRLRSFFMESLLSKKPKMHSGSLGAPLCPPSRHLPRPCEPPPCSSCLHVCRAWPSLSPELLV